MLFIGSNYIWIGYDSSDIIFPQLNCSSGAKLAFGRQLIYSKRSGFFFFWPDGSVVRMGSAVPHEPSGFSIWLGSLFWENGLIPIEDAVVVIILKI